MRRLLILRHAKSDWSGGGSDHARPLNERGRASADLIGRHLAGIDQVPDRVITSSAVRARTTVERAVAAGGWASPVTTADALYESSPSSVLELVRTLDEGDRCVLIAGHEPTSSAVVSALVGGGCIQMPTGALARVDLDVARWRDVDWGAGALRWLVTPKSLAPLADGDARS